MRFPGLLQIPESDGQGVRVVLQLEDGLVTLGYRDGVLGTWPLEEIRVHRKSDTRFVFDLGADQIDFVTYDPLTLVTELLPAIETSRTGLRRTGLWPFRREQRPGSRLDQDPQQDPVQEDPVQEDPVQEDPVVRAPLEKALEVRIDETLAVRTEPTGRAPRSEDDPGLVDRLRKAGNPLLERLGMARPTIPEHDHEFVTQRLPGDLFRHVCAVCNHVSIGVPQ